MATGFFLHRTKALGQVERRIKSCLKKKKKKTVYWNTDNSCVTFSRMTLQKGKAVGGSRE